MKRDASEVLDRLLSGGHSVVAGRLAGAFRNIGRPQIADDILASMRSVGYDVRESDPFSIYFGMNPTPPFANFLAGCVVTDVAPVKDK